MVYFYSALFPFVFVYGFIILTIQYYVDRFSLFRLWGWTSQLGSELANFSRKYMFLGCLAVYALMSSFVFAQFPYDNVCDPPDATSGFSGTYAGVTLGNGERLVNEGNDREGIVVVAQDTAVAFCKYSLGLLHGFVGFSHYSCMVFLHCRRPEQRSFRRSLVSSHKAGAG